MYTRGPLIYESNGSTSHESMSRAMFHKIHCEGHGISGHVTLSRSCGEESMAGSREEKISVPHVLKVVFTSRNIFFTSSTFE